jgi:hypothetical protein
MGAILRLLGDAAPSDRKLEQGASIELGGGAGALSIQGVSKSAGFDVTTVVVTMLTSAAPALVVEWFKFRLAARQPPAPDKPLPPITVVVGDVHVSQSS